MLLNCCGNLRVARGLAKRSDCAKENRIGPAEIIHPRILFFSVFDQSRPEIAIRKGMAQGVIHGGSCQLKQILVTSDQCATKRPVSPIAFLLPRPPGCIILLTSPERAGERPRYLWQVQAQARRLFIQIQPEPALS